MNIRDMRKSFARFKERFKLGPHHKIERFGVLLGVFTTILSVIVTTGFVYKVKQDNAMLSDRAIYTEEFVTSKTEVSGNVVGIYRSKDMTKSLALIHFDDIAQVSTKASNYQMFLAGSTLDLIPQPIQGTPSGSVISFGTTGYIGFYFVDTAGFKSQLFNLVVRANSEIISAYEYGEVPDDYQVQQDESFAEFDQFRIYFNPGATQATYLRALDDDSPQVSDIYHEAIVADEERNIEEDLDKLLYDMRISLNAMDEYANRLSTTSVNGVSIINTDRPSDIKDDDVTKDDDEPHFHLKSSKVVPGGFDLDWQNGSVKQGYLHSLGPADTNWATFMATKTKEEQENSSQKEDPRVQDGKWEMSDGTYLSDYQDGIDDEGVIQDMVATSNNLADAWMTYRSLKREYQIDGMRRLLSLEMRANDVEANYSTYTDDDSLIVYMP